MMAENVILPHQHHRQEEPIDIVLILVANALVHFIVIYKSAALTFFWASLVKTSALSWPWLGVHEKCLY
jgi:hypothetical protein